MDGLMEGCFYQERAALLEALIEMGSTDKRREFLQHRRIFLLWCLALLCTLCFFSLLFHSLTLFFLPLSLSLSSFRQGVAGSPESRWQTAEGLCGKHGVEWEGNWNGASGWMVKELSVR